MVRRIQNHSLLLKAFTGKCRKKISRRYARFQFIFRIHSSVLTSNLPPCNTRLQSQSDETQIVREALLQGGFREADENEHADLCIVNTCTVTNTGDSKSRQVIRQLSRQNPGTKTIVMGCYATRAIRGRSQNFQTSSKSSQIKANYPMSWVASGSWICLTESVISKGTNCAFVKIQDGCILKCSYCIIPTVRPGLRSRRLIDIEDEIRSLVDHGYREIVISGIHMGHFGVDTNNLQPGDRPERLWHLLRRLDQIPGNWRMRLSSIETVEVNDDFIKAAGDCEHLCPQFHPGPLQSGSNTVLTRMRRRYRVERFLDRLEQIRDLLGNDPAFSTDIIVGFPGETDAEFEETLETCRQCAVYESARVSVQPPRRNSCCDNAGSGGPRSHQKTRPYSG